MNRFANAVSLVLHPVVVVLRGAEIALECRSAVMALIVSGVLTGAGIAVVVLLGFVWCLKRINVNVDDDGEWLAE